MKKDILIELDKISSSKGNKLYFRGLSWTINKNENWVITGRSGSGKTALGEVLAGKMFISAGKIVYNFSVPRDQSSYDKPIQYLSFGEDSTLFNYSKHYYQQRFNATESQDSITVAQYLQHSHYPEKLLSLFRMEALLHLEFIKLSNGQTRKIRIIKALLSKPELLILDEPFVGLDKSSRDLLRSIIDGLSELGTQLILITNNTEELPSSVTHILELEDFRIKGLWARKDYSRERPSLRNNTKGNKQHLLPRIEDLFQFQIAVRFANVNISYDDKKILKGIDWTIRKGEKWALLGPNGAGKTTLLSLINADNPQAYSQNIILFDRQRGTGESIWDIKKRIGFISPELHLYFRGSMTSLEVAATGFVDTLFLNRDLTDIERKILHELFESIEIGQLKNKDFFLLATGQQRLVLFIRSLIKNPPLLILDEPFQGMDDEMIEKCQQLLEKISSPDTTMIFVTHNLKEIPVTITNVYKIEDGIGWIDN